MKLKNAAIEGAANLLLSRQLWVDAKMFVQDVANQDMTPEEKHAKVKKDLLVVFGEIGGTLLDIAIKLAVLELKNKTGIDIKPPEV